MIYLDEFVLYKPTEEASQAFYLAHIKNKKWRAAMGAIFIFPSMFKHYNFDERRKWKNLGLHRIIKDEIDQLKICFFILAVSWIISNCHLSFVD